MERCPSCASDVPRGKRFCGDCGAALDTPSSAPTLTSLSSAPSSPTPPGRRATSAPSFDFPDHARFLPGAMLAGRYRIVGLLGRGGMGDVYRADDLRLGQTVALKFLPEAFAQDPGRLQRFLGEVRIARQVTHPNVCRVYDVGETDGQHYLSMEYVDGEDLGSLLRRIGRLPEDKAVQLARQICAGLAAAHDQGILHRDLKPANVMIDGRGRARLTDFGLAGLAEGFAGGEVRAGTPAYMAPEQLAGKSVSIKSDLYSLGLVLYELFTGKQAFSAGSTAELMQLQQETSPPSPASHVSGLDPAVERVILRCLEREPTARPASALAVAAALPGGDPLAAALAAGETPSPEMVAAAGPEGGLKPAIAMLCLASVLAGVAAVAALYEKTSLLAPIPMQKPMAALQENAREIIRKLGYPEAPADSDSQFSFNFGRFQKLVRQSVSIPEHLSSPGQLLFEFQYRQSPSDLAPMNFTGGVQPNDPPASEGDINVELDLRGRLRSLRVKPAPVEFSQEPAPAPDWSVLFETAGLDMAAFEETTPTFQPRFFADTRAAWTGALIEPVETPVRIEAAALRGKPVAFERILPSDASWSAESMADEKAKDAARSDITNAIMLTLLIALLAGAVFLALRNSRLGRGDRRGALRMAGFVFAMRLVNWLIAGHHVAGDDDVILSVVALSGALFLGALTWVLYMALEPYVRRLWPESMVGWSRLLAGRFRDPLVGRDVLVGMTLGVALQVFSEIILWIAIPQGWCPPLPRTTFLGTLRGGRYILSELFTTHLTSVAVPLGFLLLFLFFRLIFRRQWLAATAFVLLFAALGSTNVSRITGAPPEGIAPVLFGVVFSALNGFIIMTLLVRFGILATACAILAGGICDAYPLTLDFSKPYAGATVFGVLAIAAYSLYGFKTSLAGRSLFRDRILQERSA
jgi:serine/threonine-protein kinase